MEAASQSNNSVAVADSWQAQVERRIERDAQLTRRKAAGAVLKIAVGLLSSCVQSTDLGMRFKTHF
jgi:hypothetical protein